MFITISLILASLIFSSAFLLISVSTCSSLSLPSSPLLRRHLLEARLLSSLILRKAAASRSHSVSPSLGFGVMAVEVTGRAGRPLFPILQQLFLLSSFYQPSKAPAVLRLTRPCIDPGNLEKVALWPPPLFTLPDDF